MKQSHWRTARWAWVVLAALAADAAAQEPETPSRRLPGAGSEATTPKDVRPPVLNRPDGNVVPAPEPALTEPDIPFRYPMDPPLGFTGPSGVLPTEAQGDPHFVPIFDRWRTSEGPWDRYGAPRKLTDDIPYAEGAWYDPYTQNVLKGDFPIIGQHTFLKLTASNISFFDVRQVPAATTPFESTARPFQTEFFGRPNQFFYNNNLFLHFELFHGDASFKPADWKVVLTPTFNINHLDVAELGIVNPDVRKGTTRSRTYTALQEWFLEAKLADLGPDYDFISVRAGSQPFVSDFRGFLFADVNRAVRIFGTRNSNREQFNLVYFRQLEKDTNSALNTFDDRGQDLLFANYFRQDFIWPGYTMLLTAAYNHDDQSFRFDENNFLIRPDPVGVFQPHELNVVYLGWGGDGHINRFNITHQFYWALGRDSRNPIANEAQDISAQFAAVELSYDRDWARFRGSFLWSSGDHDFQNSKATGFDTILDNPAFAGGRFSFWQRQAIGLFGVNLVNNESIIPDLRRSKIQGQSNFVNPGLFLANFGVDMDLTPKIKSINNINFLWFDDTNVLEQYVFQHDINRFIGTDISTGLEYRPLLSNNIIMTSGLAMLIPGSGFKQLYNRKLGSVNPMVAGFMELVLTY